MKLFINDVMYSWNENVGKMQTLTKIVGKITTLQKYSIRHKGNITDFSRNKYNISRICSLSE